MTVVSVLGMGAMGSRIASRLADAGHEVVVWNRSIARAREVAEQVPVLVAETPADAVVGADVVIAMVADDEASRSLWLSADGGVLDSLDPGVVAIEASTITRGMAVELGAAAGARGVPFLEAPVVGSRPQAEAGALFVLVSGNNETLDSVRPVLDSYAGGIRRVGDFGDAATIKLAINGLFGTQVAAFAEVVGLLERTGIDFHDALDLLSNLPITAPGLKRILGLFAERDFAPNFPVSLVAKDLGYLEALADELAAEIPVTSAASRVFAAGANARQAELDISGIADRYLWSS